MGSFVGTLLKTDGQIMTDMRPLGTNLNGSVGQGRGTDEGGNHAGKGKETKVKLHGEGIGCRKRTKRTGVHRREAAVVL